MATNNEPVAVTQVEAARRLTVTPQTIRRWELAGHISGKRVGKLRLYPFAQLKALAGITEGQG